MSQQHPNPTQPLDDTTSAPLGDGTCLVHSPTEPTGDWCRENVLWINTDTYRAHIWFDGAWTPTPVFDDGTDLTSLSSSRTDEDEYEDNSLLLHGSLPHELWGVEIDYLPAEPDPEAAARFLVEQRERGVPEGDIRFFWPTLSKAYRSRSSARDRLAIFERYGARGHIVRARPVWERVESKDAQIARLKARVAELERR